jgi:hypothetical protein
MPSARKPSTPKKAPQTTPELVARMASSIAALEAGLAEATQNIQALAIHANNTAQRYAAVMQSLDRAEHFLYSFVRVAIREGMSYEALQESMKLYPQNTDLLVFWGVRTQEELDALIAASKPQTVDPAEATAVVPVAEAAE